MNAHQVPSPQHPAPFQQTKVLDAWASMNFTGRAIAINGMINFGWWTYEVVSRDFILFVARLLY